MQLIDHEQSWTLDVYRGDNTDAGTVPRFVIPINVAFLVGFIVTHKQLGKWTRGITT